MTWFLANLDFLFWLAIGMMLAAIPLWVVGKLLMWGSGLTKDELDSLEGNKPGPIPVSGTE